MVVSGQLHVPAALPPGKDLILIRREVGMGPRADLNAMMRKKFFLLPGIEPRSSSP
jgi:hypothetical protein